MELIYYFIVLFVHSASAKATSNHANTTNTSNTTHDVYSVIAPYEDDFTPETYAFFNVSKKYKKFDLNEMEELTRRWDIFWFNYFAARHYFSYESSQRVCYMMAVTWLAAMPEIRRYFQRRFLYMNTLEYEVGYLAYDIIYKYQMMVEIFHIIYTKYYKEPWAFKTQLTYIFYMYRNLLEYSITVIHLCNMMHELEKKYEGQPLGVWDDYPDSKEHDDKKKGTNATLKETKHNVDDYEKRRQEEYKRRRRERKKNRKLIHLGNFQLTTPVRRPKKSFWPLHYGWSIEFW